MSAATKPAPKTPATHRENCEDIAKPPTHGSLPLWDAGATGYLQRIYTAVDQIYRRGRTKPHTHRLVGDVIIQARCARVLTHLQPDRRTAYTDAIEATIPTLGGRTQFIAQQMLRMSENETTRTRFSGFVDRFGFLLLSVCAHSKSFRILINTADLAPSSRAFWQDLCDLIESHAYSIELYARTRGLDWNNPLTEGSRNGSNEWDQLICRSLYNVLDQDSDFTENQVLGISDMEYGLRHNLPDDVGHYHEWVLPSEPRTAYTPTMTYRTRRRELVTERQVNIDSSVILDDCADFRWVNRAAWPIDDPRYRGPVSDPCEVCSDESGDSTVTPQSCDHTLADLCRLRCSKIAKSSSRVELVQYPGKGVGVRALKAFRRGEIMAEYLGEIYPEYTVRRGHRVTVDIHPNGAGISYKYQQPLEIHTVNDDQEGKRRRKKTSSPKIESGTMIIDPSVTGNWPRYMNHSCRQATEFQFRYIGNKKLTLVVAFRDIRFGEEITVHYGADYWQVATYGCACGEDRCIFWDPVQNTVKGGKKVTWGAERETRRIEEEDSEEDDGAEDDGAEDDGDEDGGEEEDDEDVDGEEEEEEGVEEDNEEGDNEEEDNEEEDGEEEDSTEKESAEENSTEEDSAEEDGEQQEEKKIKNPVVKGGRNEQNAKASDAKSALTKRQYGGNEDNGPPTKKARKGARRA